MGLHNEEGAPLDQLTPLPPPHLEGVQGHGGKLWLEEPHHPLPGQSQPPKASGVAEGSDAVQHKDCPPEAQLW